ncbi:hypothetical protein C8R43DRAFT_1195573 [Mycena crocata]|nr:hypothetical protein C8R43DRAFT_1195573 [Mycena crocata]
MKRWFKFSRRATDRFCAAPAPDAALEPAGSITDRDPGPVATEISSTARGFESGHVADSTSTAASFSTCTEPESYTSVGERILPLDSSPPSYAEAQRPLPSQLLSESAVHNPIAPPENPTNHSLASSAPPLIDGNGNVVGHTIGELSLMQVNGNFTNVNINIQPAFAFEHESMANDSDSAPLHDHLHKLILKNSRTVPVLGVAMAFHKPPSLLQIARVLGLEWTDVQDALKLMSPHLDLPNLSDPAVDVDLPKYLTSSLLQRTGPLWIDLAKYHASIARWCLVGKRTIDARDIAYIAEFWAYHVCHSNSSAELHAALRKSRLPFNPTSRSKLPDVICWLENTESPPDLIATYRNQHSKQPQQVAVMHGRLKQSF